MPYVALSILAVWLVMAGWAMTAFFIVLCGAISIFYGACIAGGADERVTKFFALLVILASVAALGMLARGLDYEYDGPKMCGQIQC